MKSRGETMLSRRDLLRQRVAVISGVVSLYMVVFAAVFLAYSWRDFGAPVSETYRQKLALKLFFLVSFASTLLLLCVGSARSSRKSRGSERVALPVPQKLALWFSVGLYISSLFFNAYSYGDGRNPSWIALVAGAFTVVTGYLPWLANPMLMMAWGALLSTDDWFLLITSGAACAFAAQFWLDPRLFGDTVNVPVFDPSKFHFDLGFWLWIASMASILAVALLRTMRRKWPDTRRDGESATLAA